jgi:drug/metabolite transporter (DMT)-like permease
LWRTERGVSMTGGVLLLVVSAALHAGWNALLKREADKLVAVVAVLAVADLVAAAFGAATGELWLPAGSIGWTAVAGCAEAGYFVALAHALSRASYGLAYTVSRGAAMFLVWVVSSTWLGERVDRWIIGGVALLLAGLLLANDVGRAPRAPAAERAMGPDARGAGPAKQRLGTSYLAALFIAGYHLAYGQALARGARPAPLFAGALLVALPIVVATLGLKSAGAAWQALRRRPLSLGSAGVLATASFVVFLFGLSRTGPGVAITVRNTSIVFAQAFAWLIGERVSVRQALGAGLVASGAALVGFPH